MQDFFREYYFEAILAVLILYALVSTNIKASRKKSSIEVNVASAIRDAKAQIERAINPRVIYCASIDQVRTEASQIISDAANEFVVASSENSRLIAEGSEERQDISQYFVTIYGAASLFNESDAGKKLDSEARKDSIKRYNDALALAARHKLIFRRYVSLLSETDLAGRSKNIQDEYLHWLHQQRATLEADQNYTMIVSPRAPQWGSSNTTIIANSGLVEIKGHGNSAFAIYDRRIAVDLRASLRGDIYEAMPQNKTEIGSGNSERMKWFDEFISNCETVVK